MCSHTWPIRPLSRPSSVSSLSRPLVTMSPSSPTSPSIFVIFVAAKSLYCLHLRNPVVTCVHQIVMPPSSSSCSSSSCSPGEAWSSPFVVVDAQDVTFNSRSLPLTASLATTPRQIYYSLQVHAVAEEKPLVHSILSMVQDIILVV